jgi:ferrochelatase
VAAQEQGCLDRLELLPPFYDQPGFINACVTRLREYLAQEQPEHLIFSYHSLPVRHLKRWTLHASTCLQREDCCAQITGVNQNCYRAHCVYTTQAIAKALNLSPADYSLAFQSRLGTAGMARPADQRCAEQIGATRHQACRRQLPVFYSRLFRDVGRDQACVPTRCF